MPNFMILFDEPHEAAWFRRLHPDFQDAREEAITVAQNWPSVKGVLAYDRPDIILLDGDVPVLVVEETVEVPSGHNVGQRFARIAAAAEAGVPALYFGPYVAKKHGGATAGPRYMNIRLFHSLDAMERVTRTAITTINWPVDEHSEVRRDPNKDKDVREYISTFLTLYYSLPDLESVNAAMLQSPIHGRMISERNEFVKTRIRNPQQYDGPPDSVEFMKTNQLRLRHSIPSDAFTDIQEIVLYNVGMNKIRSDPYTGMAILYRYLYIAEHPKRALVLWFPNISVAKWRAAASNGRRKDIRLFTVAADAIQFSDQFLLRNSL